MGYGVERHGFQRSARTPVAVKLIGDWKRALSARARLFIGAGSVADAELQLLAELWLNLHTADVFFRMASGLPAPGDVPSWVDRHRNDAA